MSAKRSPYELIPKLVKEAADLTEKADLDERQALIEIMEHRRKGTAEQRIDILRGQEGFNITYKEVVDEVLARQGIDPQG